MLMTILLLQAIACTSQRSGHTNVADAPDPSGDTAPPIPASGSSSRNDGPGGPSPLVQLRYRVAAQPDDVDARLRLARAEYDAELWGAALAQFTYVHRGVGLANDNRQRFAALLLRRYRERLALGDGDAYRDAELFQTQAEQAGSKAGYPAVTEDELAAGVFAAVLARLRRGDRWGNEAAAALLTRARQLRPDDARLRTAELLSRGMLAASRAPAPSGMSAKAQNSEPLPPLDQVKEVGQWLHRGGARKAALRVLEPYIAHGGQDADALQQLIVELAWWRGTAAMRGSAASSLPPWKLIDIARLHGISLCLLATSPDAAGCGDTLLQTAVAETERRSDIAMRVWHHADANHWHTDIAEQAPAWALLALRARMGDFITGAARPWITLTADRIAPTLVSERAWILSPSAQTQATPARWALHVIAAVRAGRPAAELLQTMPMNPTAAGGVPPAEWLARGDNELARMIAQTIMGHAIRTRDWPALKHMMATHLPEAAQTTAETDTETDAAPTIAETAGTLAPAWSQNAAASAFAAHGLLGPLVWMQKQSPLTLSWWWSALNGTPQLRAAREQIWREWRALAAVSERIPEGAADRALANIEPGMITGILVAMTHAGSAQVASPHKRPPNDGANNADETVAALVRMAVWYLRDPAVAERLARDWVTGSAAKGQRGPAVAALFRAMGDRERALAWWQDIADESPRHTPYAMALGAAAAAAGLPQRAQLHFTAAAAESGDAGASALAAAAHFLATGAHLDAIAQGRRASMLTPPGARGPVFALLATAMQALGRHRDAEAMATAWLRDIPSAYHKRALARLRQHLDKSAPRKAASELPQIGPRSIEAETAALRLAMRTITDTDRTENGTENRAQLAEAAARLLALTLTAAASDIQTAAEGLAAVTDALNHLAADDASITAVRRAAAAARALAPAPIPQLTPLLPTQSKHKRINQ